MTLVSSSVPIRLQETQMESRSPYSSSSSSSSSMTGSVRGSLHHIEEEPREEKVYVALGKEFKEGKSTLVWVLQNMDRSKRFVILHVHRPAQMIPMMGAKFPASQLKPAQVREYRQAEWEKMDKALDKYTSLCVQSKVKAEKLVIEMDDVARGIIELIALHGINELVMGAAADRQYSRKMKKPKSTTAIYVLQQAEAICKIWFVCKGNLIYTSFNKEAGLVDYGIGQSPTTSLSSISNQSDIMRSISLPQGRMEPVHSIQSPLQSILRRRSLSVGYEPNAGGNMPLLSTTSRSLSSTDGSVVDLWESTPRDPQVADHSPPSVNELLGIRDLSLMPKDEESQQFSSTCHELEDIGMDDELYKRLLEAQTEAENLMHEAYQEARMRQIAQRDAIDAARKARASENLYAKELKLRKEVEELLAREKMEVEELKIQRDNVIEELDKVIKQESALEQQIADSDFLFKELEDKLSEAQHLLSSLQQEYHELEGERDDAVREAEELRQMKEEAEIDGQRVMNFSEFSYAEIEQATHNFDDSMKIGEGGYGSVYKGFLRHTMVAIKVLNPESTQGQAEFHHEVEVLTKVRHPHVVTLIGVCSEARALIYEYCINGSLEDRLLCKDNTAPLTWQVRVRIAAEICLALIFLHSNQPLNVIHGDLKPANILIDANFVSKLGDFGICRLVAHSNTTTTIYHHTHPQGTFVYMDPEFLQSGDLTPRSDVYSFGVILLRMLTGRPPFGLVKEVQQALNDNRLESILDPTAGDWPFVLANQLAHLALRCCEIKRKKRPDLSLEAWKVLEPMTRATSAVCSSSMSFGSTIEDTSNIPSYFICPIFQEIMTDPHIAADGFTYEAEALRGWLDSGHATSPMTNVQLSNQDLIPNRALRSAIQEWLQQHT